MKGLAFTPAAEADLVGIWRYSAQHWGPDQADRYTDELQDTCRALATGRKKGRAVEIRPGYLKCTCGAHVVYFQDQGDRLKIIRILHSKQDVARQLHS